MKVTLISQYFYPEMISTGHILTELLVEIRKKGVAASVICAQPSYYSAEKYPVRIKFHGIDIERTQNTQFDKNTLKGKIYNSATFLLHSLILSLKINRHGSVMLVTNPPYLGILGPILSRIKKVSFLLIIHDLYPQIAVNMGFLGHRSLLTLLWRKINRWIYCKASFVIVLGRDTKILISDQMRKDDQQKIVYIPNWADSSLIEPVESKKNPFIKELGLKNKFIVQYSGNMGITHDMETIIQAAAALKDDDEIHFLLIGGGGKLEKVKRMALDYELQNISFLPYQPRENLRYSLSASDVSLISLESAANGLSVPSKLYGIMASGRPIIAIVSESSEVAIAIKEAKCGMLTPPKDVIKLVNAITWMRDNVSCRHEMGNRAYQAFLDKYTVEHGAEKYIQLLRQCGQNNDH
ncbi:glycosyltransferase family 4 protein [bacterium]|nr:glycosyltransferase family 4 protein [bacterium]